MRKQASHRTACRKLEYIGRFGEVDIINVNIRISGSQAM